MASAEESGRARRTLYTQPGRRHCWQGSGGDRSLGIVSPKIELHTAAVLQNLQRVLVLELLHVLGQAIETNLIHPIKLAVGS